MDSTATPITIPLGERREIIVTPTDNPDCVKLILHGRHSGALVIVPQSGNSITLLAEVRCQPVNLSSSR